MYLQSFLVFSDLSTYYHVQFQNIIITSKRNPFPIHKPLSIPSFPCPLDCHLIYCVFMNFPILDIYMCFTQPCPSLCSPKDCTPPGSSVLRIFLTSILEWVAISYSRKSSLPRDRNCVSGISCIGRWFFTTSTTWEDVYINRIISPMDMYIRLLSFSTVFS